MDHFCRQPFGRARAGAFCVDFLYFYRSGASHRGDEQKSWHSGWERAFPSRSVKTGGLATLRSYIFFETTTMLIIITFSKGFENQIRF